MTASRLWVGSLTGLSSRSATASRLVGGAAFLAFLGGCSTTVVSDDDTSHKSAALCCGVLCCVAP